MHNLLVGSQSLTAVWSLASRNQRGSKRRQTRLRNYFISFPFLPVFSSSSWQTFTSKNSPHLPHTRRLFPFLTEIQVSYLYRSVLASLQWFIVCCTEIKAKRRGWIERWWSCFLKTLANIALSSTAATMCAPQLLQMEIKLNKFPVESETF